MEFVLEFFKMQLEPYTIDSKTLEWKRNLIERVDFVTAIEQ
jgi:hypothetical protein